MSKISQETIDQYRRMLAKDPSSKVFAPLAEALREAGLGLQAERIAADGVQRHPEYVGGYAALGRILLDQLRYSEALPILKKGTELDPENILALHLLGNTYVQLKNPKAALKAFKMVLFLNPLSEKARAAVQKLEVLSADEYDEDAFQFKKLSSDQIEEERPFVEAIQRQNDPAPPLSMTGLLPKELDRKLSLVDALIIRNDLQRARAALVELSLRAPGDPEIQRRFELIGDSGSDEEAADLHPLIGRETAIFERKKALLENLLQRVRQYQEGSVSEMT